MARQSMRITPSSGTLAANAGRESGGPRPSTSFGTKREGKQRARTLGAAIATRQ